MAVDEGREKTISLGPSPWAPHVVLLDQDEAFVGTLVRLLNRAGFRATAAHSPRQAMEAAVREQPDVIVADLQLDGMNGSVVLAMLAEAAPQTARVLMTSETDFGTVASLAAPYSAHSFVAKGDAHETLVPTIRALLANKRAVGRAAISDDVVRGLARSIVRALEMKDGESEAQGERLALWARRLAEELELPGDRVFDVELGAMMHDIGMIGIREALLLKPGRLNEAEWAEMRRHPELGVSLLADIPALRRAIPVVHSHHERWDGGGYPRGLAGDAIPIDARIFQVADAYNVIVSDRPYRLGRTDAEAREELRRCVGSQFDPQIIAAFERIEPEEWTQIGRLSR